MRKTVILAEPAKKKKERESHKKPAKEVEDLGNGDDDGTGNGEIRNTCNC